MKGTVYIEFQAFGVVAIIRICGKSLLEVMK